MGARFKVDENLPREAQALRLSVGHDAQTVHEERLVGHPDATIFDICLREDRVLITLDLDFSDIRQYPPSVELVLEANRTLAEESIQGKEVIREPLIIAAE